MAIDPSVVGRELAPVTAVIEAGRLALFATATGQDDPVYSDPAAARAAGHPGVPVPPTFLFGIELDQPEPFGWLTDLGVDLRHVLHGEQSFTYHAQAYAGEEVTARPHIAEVYSKKSGTLQFIAKHTRVTRVDGTAVADLESLIVVREPAPAHPREEQR
ncbi:MaoC family dehydratase N-terminal domain-containing protein [Tomitella cavernea]|uniref:MaoC family dehydratase N-terminal domain-containing protein n=1 Tax=Tomitella cavernea TaxID=1387982 RepID=A0ABP9CRF8_9ACTN|nr:MaoC family dehydratase N-terminal domain-containing protein [Tomitella cavernea]